MKLYNSQGELVEVNRNNICIVGDKELNVFKEWVKEIASKTEHPFDSDSLQYKVNPHNASILMYKEAKWTEREISDTNKDEIHGLAFYHNFADGIVSNTLHFVTSKDNFEKGNLGLLLENGLETDWKHFSEIGVLSTAQIERFQPFQKDRDAHCKNSYLIVNSYSTTKSQMYGIMKEIKNDPDFTKVYYKPEEKKIYFSYHDKQDCIFVRQNLILYQGHVIGNPNQFIDLYKNHRLEYPKTKYEEYTKDDNFRNHVIKGTPLKDDKFVEHEEQEAVM